MTQREHRHFHFLLMKAYFSLSLPNVSRGCAMLQYVSDPLLMLSILNKYSKNEEASQRALTHKDRRIWSLIIEFLSDAVYSDEFKGKSDGQRKLKKVWDNRNYMPAWMLCMIAKRAQGLNVKRNIMLV